MNKIIENGGERLNKKLKEKIGEAFSSVLPISIIVLLISVFFAPVPTGTMMMFLVGAALLIVGMGFFTLGADMAMMPMGEGIGVQFTKTKKLWLTIILIFGMGVIITIAEPDLQVLVKQVTAIPDLVLIFAVAVGVGIFLVLSILRIFFQISLSKLLIISYAIVLLVSLFAPNDFIPVAFDSGGVTTGPITVPFIMALGLGLSSVRGDKTSREDSFGLVALCSIGPILAVLLLSIGYNTGEANVSSFVIPDVVTTQDVVRQFTQEFPVYFKEVLLALTPIVIFFLIFQILVRRYHKRQLLKIGVGFVYTMIGLVLFLTGVNVGFIPMGYLVGFTISASALKWLLIPLGMLMGYFIVSAEPAVHILNKQVEQVSGGAIPAKSMSLCLSIGVCISIGLSILRILTGISIFWFLIPGYAIALILTFFVPKIFTGIAFDSGGVATGPMTSTFLLPFALGTCAGVGGNIMTDAFGIVAMVAMTPLIVIQILGVIYGRKMKALKENEANEMADTDNEVISYEEENNYA